MIVGTFGFTAIEGMQLLDSFYFSIVTIATVGYGDIRPATSAGKILAVILIISGIGTFLGVVANATELMLSRREQHHRREKLNMVIGVFFSEIGISLLSFFSEADQSAEEIRNELTIESSWTEEDFKKVEASLGIYKYELAKEKFNFAELSALATPKKDLLIRLMENPAILEHESFAELLRAVFHLTEELNYRTGIPELPDADLAHIVIDATRAYRLLAYQWIDYMRHLKRNYPYLFSLAMRTNPFDSNASPVITE
jgi:hypothetical protein